MNSGAVKADTVGNTRVVVLLVILAIQPHYLHSKSFADASHYFIYLGDLQRKLGFRALSSKLKITEHVSPSSLGISRLIRPADQYWLSSRVIFSFARQIFDVLNAVLAKSC